MLKLHTFDVGNGDSLLLEFAAPDGVTRFGVIDCNVGRHGSNPVLERLQSLGAQRLSFVLLTHPHMDHFTGMYSVLDAYRGRIDRFASFPIGLHIQGRLKKLGNAYKKLQVDTDSNTFRRGVQELLRVLHFAKSELINDWLELQGPDNRMMVPGFDGVSIKVLAPLPRVKGAFFDAIEKGDIGPLLRAEQENQYSVALRISYAGKFVILGGDATFENWEGLAKQWSSISENFRSQVVKMPHHGSKRDCPSTVIDNLFSAGEEERVAIFSADGRRHPDKETYAHVVGKGILPYCTNLATECGARGVSRVRVPDLEQDLARYVEVVHEEPTTASTQVCQGHITMKIEPTGDLSMETQVGTLCPYRDGLVLTAA